MLRAGDGGFVVPREIVSAQDFGGASGVVGFVGVDGTVEYVVDGDGVCLVHLYSGVGICEIFRAPCVWNRIEVESRRWAAMFDADGEAGYDAHSFLGNCAACRFHLDGHKLPRLKGLRLCRQILELCV